jgi:hypothetical protein
VRQHYPPPMASRVEHVAVLTVLLAGASGGCFDVSKLVFDLDGGPDCGTFSTPPASSLVTHFDGTNGGMSTGWASLNGCSTEQGGDLVATPVPGQLSFCKYYTTEDYHLTCDELTVKVPEATTQILGVQTFIYLVTDADAGSSLQLLLESGGFTLGSSLSSTGQPLFGADYEPASDIWWRLRGLRGSEAGVQRLEFDTSPDGTTWTTKGSAPVPGSLDSVKIELGAGEENDGGVGNPGQARFACYNVAPENCPP